MNTMIKVCGMTDADNIRDVEVLGVDMIGFIFYPKSPRYLYQIPRYLPTLAKRVGVFVNETKENILMYVDRFGLDSNSTGAFCNVTLAVPLSCLAVASILTASKP